MSAFQKRDSRDANANKAVKPFCKVCHDAGKPESEYTSHFVKSAPGITGVVVCPTLLAQQCGYCHTSGHTVSYCKLLKQHQKAKEHYNRKCDFQETQNKTVVQQPKKNRTSAFAALAEDSDDEIDAKVVKQAMCQFPALCEVKHVQKTNAISYAGMASKPAVLSGNAFDEAFQVAQIKKIKTKTKTIVTHNVSKRWVDMMSDSDDDDDDEEMSVSEISNDCW
jgi:hypothetical protein